MLRDGLNQNGLRYRSFLASSHGSRWGVALGLVFFAWLGCSFPAIGQQRYTPDSVEVEEIVASALQRLEQLKPRNLGERSLAALAIVEARKRYEQGDAVSSPMVQSAVEEILANLSAEVPSGINDSHLLTMVEVYAPVMATILLAELDKTRFRSEVSRLVESIESRFQSHGALTYMNRDLSVGDTSQVQYAVLALYVANQHGFRVDSQKAKQALQWLVDSQQPSGDFYYQLQEQGGRWRPNNASPDSGLAIHVGGLGTVYMLADMLRLFPRAKRMAQVRTEETFVDLPKTVVDYVPAADGEGQSPFAGEGPVVSFNVGKLRTTTGDGNRSLVSRFEIDIPIWNFYYLYALERYAWFREQAEGSLTGKGLSNWYDAGVDFIKEHREPSGGFFKISFMSETELIATSLGILFLVRSSEIISAPPRESDLIGDIGFPAGNLSVDGGRVVGGDAEKDMSALMGMLQDKPSEDQLEAIAQSMKKAIEDFNNMEDKSRGEVKAFLRTMVMSNNYFRRKIAVRFLASEQDMDNVPALLYLMGDEEFDICMEAHDGLRLISRRIDTMPLSEDTRRKSEDPYLIREDSNDVQQMRDEYDALKRQWTEWFLRVRPNADLLD